MPRHQDMDAQRLCAIVTDAVATVVCVHVNNKFHLLADIYRSTIVETVIKTFHLREQARDIDVALLEIACDAAVAVAHKYNARNVDNELNPRWVYCCVQSLLSIQLKPELMLDGKVDRLLPSPTTTAHSAVLGGQRKDDEDGQYPRADVDMHAESTGKEGPTVSSAPSPVSIVREPHGAAVQVDTITLSEYSRDDGAGVVCLLPHRVTIKDAKTPWSDDDVRKMIEFKASGLTHEQVATRIGRGRGAVENKYGRVVKEDAWQSVVARYGARAGGRGKKRQTPPPHDDSIGVDDGQIQIEVPLSKKARSLQPNA